MILSGNCREDFLKEYGGQEWEFNEKYEMVLVIEFLDSKQLKGEKFFSHVFNLLNPISLVSMSHIDVCKQAIELCNNHYNNFFNSNDFKLMGYKNGEIIYKKQKP